MSKDARELSANPNVSANNHARVAASPENAGASSARSTTSADTTQAEPKRFLGWLEGAVKIKPGRYGNTGVEALTGKTTQRGCLGDYQKGQDAVPFDAIWDILHKNRTRVGVSVNDARFIAKLRTEDEKSLGTGQGAAGADGRRRRSQW